MQTRRDELEQIIQQGIAHQRAGRPTQAAEAFHDVLARDPDHTDALLLLGILAHEAGRNTQAEELISRAVSIAPDNAVYHYNLALVRTTLGRRDEACDSYRRALQLKPDYPEAHNNLGILLHEAGRLLEAAEHYRTAVALRPDYVTAHLHLGHILNHLGSLAEAEAAYRQVLKLQPDHTEAYRLLVWHRRYTERDADVEAMENLWSSPRLDSMSRMHLAFALGKVCEDLGEFDRAFEYFSQGNQLKRASFRYDVARDEHDAARLMEAMSAEFFAKRRDWGSTDATPVIIVGMPRSGTTLVEQILASHSEVAGGGELSDLKQVIAADLRSRQLRNLIDGITTLDAGSAMRLGDHYVARLKQHTGTNVAHVTDKMPGNFLFVGLLRITLPRARVIHCRRDPLDTCWSIYKHLFTGHQPFAYDLEELGRFYRLYQRLMAHWAAVLPGYVLEFDYESLVHNQEDATRKLLDFCNLPWDDNCLDFHRTVRGVRTASLAQVRKPVYKSSIGAWRRYADHLGALVSALTDGA